MIVDRKQRDKLVAYKKSAGTKFGFVAGSKEHNAKLKHYVST
jgi:hypothetical protein